jgi:O-antigen ligase
MALAAIAMPYLGWYLLQRAQGWRRAAYGVGILCNIAVGLATASDGLRVAWLGGLGVIGMIAWLRPGLRRGSLLQYIFYVIIPLLIATGAVALGPEIIAGLERVATSVYEEGDQGKIRIAAWLNGLRAMAESPLVGWGPGSFSGMTGPFQRFEAHNSLIDWGMSTGALGIALHVALRVWCGRCALNAGALTLVGALTSLVIASMFGYFLRQPVYWLILMLTLTLSRREEAHGVAHDVRIDHAGHRRPIGLQSR